MGEAARGVRLSRRGVLGFGAAALAAPMLESALAQTLAGDDALPIAFLDRSDELEAPDAVLAALAGSGAGSADPGFDEEALDFDLVSARSLPLGDQELALRPVEITIDGLYPYGAELSLPALERAVLRFWIPSPDPSLPESLPFDAWSFNRYPVPNVGSGIRFVLPTGAFGDLRVTLELTERQRAAARGARLGRRASGRTAVRGGRESAERESTTTRRLGADFTTDWFDQRPKLRRGVYLLGVEPGLFRSASLRRLAAAPAQPVLVMAVDRAEDDGEA